MTAPEKRASILNATSSTRQKFSGSAHLKKDAKTGEVVIPDVPMVDQGQKGYCVVAATERVLRYYSIDVDANELAQVANSDAERGTSFEGMFAARKQITSRVRVRVRGLGVESVEGYVGRW